MCAHACVVCVHSADWILAVELDIGQILTIISKWGHNGQAIKLQLCKLLTASSTTGKVFHAQVWFTVNQSIRINANSWQFYEHMGKCQILNTLVCYSDLNAKSWKWLNTSNALSRNIVWTVKFDYSEV